MKIFMLSKFLGKVISSRPFVRILNAVFIPVRLIFSHDIVNKMGLRSIRDERCDIIIKHCTGKLLDIGCGNNQIVKEYGHNSIGVDVYDFGSDAYIVEDTSKLPFDSNSFQTVSFVASLNHIPNRIEVLKEAHRLLSDDGVLLITMINPLWGTIRHKLAWWDEDKHERRMKEGEKMGISSHELVSTVENQGFTFVRRKSFILGINNLYIFKNISRFANNN